MAKGDASEQVGGQIYLTAPEKSKLENLTMYARDFVKDATRFAQKADNLVGRILPKDSEMAVALKNAQIPKNIKDVQIAKVSEERDMYSVAITLNGTPRILTIVLGPKSLDVMLTDLKGTPIEHLEQGASGKIFFSKLKTSQ